MNPYEYGPYHLRRAPFPPLRLDFQSEVRLHPLRREECGIAFRSVPVVYPQRSRFTGFGGFVGQVDGQAIIAGKDDYVEDDDSDHVKDENGARSEHSIEGDDTDDVGTDELSGDVDVGRKNYGRSPQSGRVPTGSLGDPNQQSIQT